jgi:hypothetical protein
MRFATAQDFFFKSDPRLTPYIEVYPVDVPYDEDLLMAFWAATRLIGKVLSRPSFTQVILGTPPFSIPSGHHVLRFEQSDVAVATTWKGVILPSVTRTMRKQRHVGPRYCL